MCRNWSIRICTFREPLVLGTDCSSPHKYGPAGQKCPGRTCPCTGGQHSCVYVKLTRAEWSFVVTLHCDLPRCHCRERPGIETGMVTGTRLCPSMWRVRWQPRGSRTVAYFERIAIFKPSRYFALAVVVGCDYWSLEYLAQFMDGSLNSLLTSFRDQDITTLHC